MPRCLSLAHLCCVLSVAAATACKDKPPPTGSEPTARSEETITTGQGDSDDKDAAAKANATGGTPADGLTLPQLPEMPIPKDNPQSDAKVRLGHWLFFEKKLSADGSVSCYSCHQNEHGNGGGRPTAVGAKGKQLTRHSPVIWNVGYLPKLYWDGRADSLEAQAKGAWAGGNMGVGRENLEAKAKELAKLPLYEKQFEKAFPGQDVTAELVAKALAAYERTLICDDTAYDAYAAGDKSALTDQQKAGLTLFMGKAMCSACHAPPHFSTAYMGEGAFFNVGVGIEGKDEQDVDVGRMAVTEQKSDWAAFKPPTLRNVTKSAPYFHDGHESDLERAVTFMASGGYDNENKTPLMTDKKLSKEELGLIVQFLAALECSNALEEPKLAIMGVGSEQKAQ